MLEERMKESQYDRIVLTKKGKIKKMHGTKLHQRMREILTVPQNKY